MITLFLRIRIAFVAVSLLLLSTWPAWQISSGQRNFSNTEPLTIANAVEIALRTHPLTRATRSGSQLADANLAEATAGRLPKLVATGNFTRSNNPVFVFGSLLEQGSFGPENFAIDSLNHPDSINNFRSALTLRLPLFDQRQTETRIASARITQQQAEHQTALVEQQVRFEVIRTYYGLLLSQARLKVTDEAVKTAEADIKRTRDMFETGLVVQSDLLAAQVQLAEFRQAQIQSSGELATAQAALNTALGLSVETPQHLSGELLNRTFTVDAVEVLSSLALQNRSDYQQAALASRAKSIELRRARGEWLPRVDAFVTAGHSSANFIGGSGDYAAGGTVTFNLFDSGRKARIAQGQAAESIANAQQEQLANQIRFEVVRTYQQYISARERLKVVAEVSAQARETLRIVQDRYQAGITTITELLRAQTALVRARSDVLAARYDQYVGYASVLLATGQLKDVNLFES
jgi:outer membrane protein